MPPKRRFLNTADFIRLAKETHGDKYDYSLSEFTGSKNKVRIICPVHGEFEQQAKYHLKGHDCFRCGVEKSAAAHLLSSEDFISKAMEVHGDRFDYSRLVYSKSSVKVNISCKQHGEFWILPFDHLKGGCPKCGIAERSEKAKFSRAEFIEKAEAIHGKKYDYSLVEYVKSTEKVAILCPIHGVFHQEANSHLQGKGCAECADLKLADARRLTLEDFIQSAKKVHGDRYGYSKVFYLSYGAKVTIVCAEHGDFRQTPADHLSGKGCRKCASVKNGLYSRHTTGSFIEKAKEIHGDRYDYSLVSYSTGKDHVPIKCERHGVFHQLAYAHLNGQGCPVCGRDYASDAEKEMSDFVESLAAVKRNDRSVIRPLEIDCLVEDSAIGFEFCGLFYHSSKFKDDDYHLYKARLASSAGLRLLQIFEDEWAFKKDIVKSIIKTSLGKTDVKINARNLEKRVISKTTAKDFINSNHIQGWSEAEFCYGLFSDTDLVAVATFSSSRSALHDLESGYFELVRYCSLLNSSIRGGLSKLISEFVADKNPLAIKTFCDLRLFSGKGYEAVGFKLQHISKPGYYYVNGLKRLSRLGFRKHLLASKLKVFDPKLSERENMRLNGYNRIYDCGNAVYLCRLTQHGAE